MFINVNNELIMAYEYEQSIEIKLKIQLIKIKLDKCQNTNMQMQEELVSLEHEYDNLCKSKTMELSKKIYEKREEISGETMHINTMSLGIYPDKYNMCLEAVSFPQYETEKEYIEEEEVIIESLKKITKLKIELMELKKEYKNKINEDNI